MRRKGQLSSPAQECGRKPPTLIGNALSLKGERVLLFSGEMHFWRIDPEYWESCLRQLKAMDLRIVSTYLSWRRHSVSPQENDLTGNTDSRLNLPAFLRLCQELGLWVHLRPGPWICAEEENGGYPDWLLSDREILVRDSRGRPVVGYFPPFGGHIPSYLHPKYLEHVRKWLTDLDACIEDFQYPDGPIILLQLDNEPSMTFRDGMFQSDYNPVNVESVYPRWLKEKYASVGALNLAYRSVYTDFSGVEAPEDLGLRHLSDLRRYTDWAEFKEWLLAKHIETLRDIHLTNGIDGVLFTVNYNHHWPMSVPNNWSKLEQASGLGGYDYYAVPPLRREDFVDLVRAVNYSLVTSKLPWSPEIMSGMWRFEGSEQVPTGLLPTHMETLYSLALAYGLKGMNFYMLVNRENWVGAPVDEKGQPTQTYIAPKKVTSLVKTIKAFPLLRKTQGVAVMYYRPYAWAAYVAGHRNVVVEGVDVGKAYGLFEAVHAALLDLHYDPAIFDPFVNSEIDMASYHLVFVPSSVYMDDGTQTLLRGYAEAGGIVVFFPELPHLDLDFKPCSYFDQDMEYLEAECDPGLRFGQHVLGEGIVVLLKRCAFAEDEGSGRKQNVEALGSFLNYHGLVPEVGVDDPDIAAVLQRNEVERILFLVDTKHKAREVNLRFRGVGTARLEEICTGGAVLCIRGGEVTVTTEGKTLRVFRMLEGV